MRRFFEFFLAFAATLVALPIMAGIAISIAARRDGPVLFRQDRIGKHKQPFTIYKFRTMCHRRADEIDQFCENVLTSTKDVRITPIGRILRACSLDELPQLFNVLKGEMSLVGPRPLIPEQLLAIPEQFDWRFLVLPGITGWAQINGRRSLDWIKQLELDSWYVKNTNLYLDARILLKTILVIIKGSGNYGNLQNNWRSYILRQ